MQFFVYDKLLAMDSVSALAVEEFRYGDQNGYNVLMAVRATADDMMTWLKAHPNSSAELVFPSGGLGLADEAFSDSFQKQLWDGTGLSKSNHITIRGAGGARGSEVIARWDFPSGVRTRDYGPWAGVKTDGTPDARPCPRFLFPLLVKSGPVAPIGISVQDLRLGCLAGIGKAPIPLFKCNELDAMNQNLSIAGFANWGLTITGTYNSTWSNIAIEGCGTQAVEGGAILGAAPGFPATDVVFNTSLVVAGEKGRLRVTARKLGADVAYFNTAQIGKRLFVHQGVSIDGSPVGVGQGVVGTIAAVAANGFSADITFSPTLLGRVTTGTNASFLPVRALVAANNKVVTLTDRVKMGAGAADMVGHFVYLPKAGGTGGPGYLQSARDGLFTRIVAVGDGNDTIGYRQITLAEEPRLSVGGTGPEAGTPLIMGATFALAREEALDRMGQLMGNNDTDFIHLRAENSGGYSGDPRTSSTAAVLAAVDGAVNFVSCKFHGGNPNQGSNAQDAYLVIMDCVTAARFDGLTVTHGGWGGKGQVWMTGRFANVQVSGLELGGWQLDQTAPLLFLDPSFDLSARGYNVSAGDITVSNSFWPANAQTLVRTNGNRKLSVQVTPDDSGVPNGTLRVTTGC